MDNYVNLASISDVYGCRNNISIKCQIFSVKTASSWPICIFQALSIIIDVNLAEATARNKYWKGQRDACLNRAHE